MSSPLGSTTAAEIPTGEAAPVAAAAAADPVLAPALPASEPASSTEAPADALPGDADVPPGDTAATDETAAPGPAASSSTPPAAPETEPPPLPTPDPLASPDLSPAPPTDAPIEGAVVEQATVQAPPGDFDLGNGWHLDLGVSFLERVAMTQLSAIEIERPGPDDGSRLAPTTGFENRLRVGGYAAFRHRTGFLREIRADVAADLFAGPFSTELEDEVLRYDPLQPDPDGLATTDAQLLRRLSLEVTTIAGRVSGGRTVNSWGLGILAQSAEDDPLQFGIKRSGNLVDRVSVMLLPASWFIGERALTEAPFYIGTSYDWLVHDDRLFDSLGDEGNNIIATAGWFGRDIQAGFFGVRRLQQDALGLRTDAWVSDVFARGVLDLDGWKLQLATEWALIIGETEAFRSYANPEQADIQQFGGVVRIDLDKDWFIARLEGGYASGDSRPYDDTIHSMSFASDYRVGLALFPELLRRQTAVSAYNMQDPRFTGEAPVGFERTPSRGALSGAMYIHPVLGLRPFPNLLIVSGALFARSTADYVDLYQTGLAGGTPTGPRGATHKRNLGVELEVGVRYDQPIGAGFSIAGRFDAAVFFPGEVFDDADGGSASGLAATVGQILLAGAW